MPVTTRARSAQVKKPQSTQASAGATRMRPGQYQASQSSSSRATAGPSNTSRQSVAQQAPANSPPGDSSEEESDDSDEDDDDDAPQGPAGQGQRQQGNPQPLNLPTPIYAALSAFNEDGLSPRAFAMGQQANFSQRTQFLRTLAAGLTSLVPNGTDVATVQTAIRVPSPQWAAQLAESLNRRFQQIHLGLQANSAGQAGGQDVVQTVNAMRGLFFAINDIRVDYFPTMDAVNKGNFVTLLVTMLSYIIEHNADLYRGIDRPAYAGEANRNERRLFSCWFAEESQPIQFLTILGSCQADLRGQGARLRTLHGLVQQYIVSGVLSVADLTRLPLHTALDRLARSKFNASCNITFYNLAGH